MGGTLSVLDDTTIDIGKPNTIKALRMGVCANALKNPPKQVAATKAMTSLAPMACKPLKMSHDAPQASRAGTGQVKSFINEQVSCVTKNDGAYPVCFDLPNERALVCPRLRMHNLRPRTQSASSRRHNIMKETT